MTIFTNANDGIQPSDDPLPKITQPVPLRRQNHTVIAATWLFKDKLSPAEGLKIDGYLECTLAHHREHLTVGKHARVEADLDAHTVVVFGQLIGNIHSDGTVLLAKGSDVKGNIHCACLYIEEGARFKGQIRMETAGAGQ